MVILLALVFSGVQEAWGIKTRPVGITAEAGSMAVLVEEAVVVRVQVGRGLVLLVAVMVDTQVPRPQPPVAVRTRVAEVVEAAALLGYLCQGGQADPAIAWSCGRNRNLVRI
ncbi:hypothetical protein GCM10027195_25420 [Comamonas sediminis]